MNFSAAVENGLQSRLESFWHLSGEKIRTLARCHDSSNGAPVYTVQGKYTARGWTEWTEGFLYGSPLLQFEAEGDPWFLEYGRDNTVRVMSPHLTHTGVHDHGFNNVSTYGTLLRLMNEGKIPDNPWERNFYELALKVTGAVQASRWTETSDGSGFIYSFNGPHSLFVDTVRTLRALGLGWLLGQTLKAENDTPVSLLERLVQHLLTTARYSVYYGEGRDLYDEKGRVAHESIFNTIDGRYRCPNSQQGYSPFSTWTRGLAWIILGFAEQLEFIDARSESELEPYGGKERIIGIMRRVLTSTSDFYLQSTPSDGIPYWDTGAPALHLLERAKDAPADPFNPYEPVDSSAAAIACQGLMRYGHFLMSRGEAAGDLYYRSGLRILSRLLEEPYLSTDISHQGLLLHSVYHRPNGWDHVPGSGSVPFGESCMWGDYHLRETALYVQSLFRGDPPYLTYWGNTDDYGRSR